MVEHSLGKGKVVDSNSTLGSKKMSTEKSILHLIEHGGVLGGGKRQVVLDDSILSSVDENEFFKALMKFFKEGKIDDILKPFVVREKDC